MALPPRECTSCWMCVLPFFTMLHMKSKMKMSRLMEVPVDLALLDGFLGRRGHGHESVVDAAVQRQQVNAALKRHVHQVGDFIHAQHGPALLARRHV